MSCRSDDGSRRFKANSALSQRARGVRQSAPNIDLPHSVLFRSLPHNRRRRDTPPLGGPDKGGQLLQSSICELCRPPVIRRIATVGGLTLASRVTGFVRDVIMAAVLGAGPVADAFFVAFRLPNHFRAILAEGAFNAAFVPAYARTLEQSGLPAARLFSDRIAAALLVINLFLLGLALVFTPSVVSLLAPGLDQDPTRYDLAGDAYPSNIPRSAARIDANHDLR